MIRSCAWTDVVIVCLFVGVFAAIVRRSWGGLFALHSIVSAGILLTASCLLVLLIVRRHSHRK
jgi:hypothetical protein